jgi:hypothetical protein
MVQIFSSCHYAKPESLFVNNVKSTNYDSLSGQFLYNSLFPLTGYKTEFTYKIFYRFRTNIVGNIIIIGNDTFSADTSLQGNFSFTVQNGAITPDTFELKCWNRDLGFYHENNKVTTANKTMKTLEIRFSGDSGLAQYWYTKVLVEVTSTITKDKETFSLSKTGSYLSYTFPLTIASSPLGNNGILEITDIDTLGATFRNTETLPLPLDTFNITIPYNGTSGINGNSSLADKPFQCHIKKALQGKTVVVLKNLPSSGEITLYTIKGQSILKQKAAAGNSIFTFELLKASSIYVINLKYGNRVVKQLLIVN